MTEALRHSEAFNDFLSRGFFLKEKPVKCLRMPQNFVGSYTPNQGLIICLEISNASRTGKRIMQTETSDQKRQAYGRATSDPYRLLALSVITKAIQDARRGNKSARAWLATDAAFWLEGCGVDVEQDYWRSWVLSGCPRPNRGGARLLR